MFDQHASYLKLALRPKELATVAREIIPPEVLQRRPALIGTGVSGALSVAALGALLDLPYGVVRKDGDGTHSLYAVELSPYFRGDWIFVDDLIATGATARRVIAAMRARPYSGSGAPDGAFLFAISGGRYYDAAEFQAVAFPYDGPY